MKILVVSYYFPPFSDSGVYRTTKFVKYMSQFGCLPFVLTAADPYALNEDESLLREIPDDVPVYRARSLMPMKILRKMRETWIASSNAQAVSSLKSNVGLFFRKMFRLAFVNLLIPDIMITWAPFAYRLGKSICMKENIQVIFATDPPSDYLVGSALSHRFNVPLVVDFRDSWTLRHYGVIAKGVIRKNLERRMENHVFCQAKYVVFVNSHMKKKYENAYPEKKEKFCVIPNGYDEEDFSRSVDATKQAESPETVFTLLYAGRLSEFQNPLFLFRALRSLLDDNVISQDTFQLSFVGDFHFAFRQIIHDLNLENLVRIRPYLPHSTIVNEMMTADALLLMCGDDAEITTGKLYEYLGANRPVLALAPVNGEAARIIHETRAGIVAQQDNVQEIKRALGLILQMGKQREWSNLQKNVIPYTRRNLARQVCDIFHSVTL